MPKILSEKVINTIAEIDQKQQIILLKVLLTEVLEAFEEAGADETHVKAVLSNVTAEQIAISLARHLTKGPEHASCLRLQLDAILAEMQQQAIENFTDCFDNSGVYNERFTNPFRTSSVNQKTYEDALEQLRSKKGE